MTFRSSELTSRKQFPLHRPSTVMGMPERCSPARIRFTALTRALACSAPFRPVFNLRRAAPAGTSLELLIVEKNC
jgi:hypothetical protein